MGYTAPFIQSVGGNSGPALAFDLFWRLSFVSSVRQRSTDRVDKYNQTKHPFAIAPDLLIVVLNSDQSSSHTGNCPFHRAVPRKPQFNFTS